MLNVIINILIVFALLMSVCICFTVCDKFITERNIYRDRWINAVEKYNSHLIDENYDLRVEIDELKTADDEEKENA